MADETRLYRFGEEEIKAPADMSIDEVRQVWEDSQPAIANAEVVEESDGSVTFALRAGTKG